jgi:hypothetical protein
VDERYKRNPNTRCVICGDPIYKRPIEIRRNKGRVFCSQACYGISCRKEEPCVVCGIPILAGLNKKTCSRACANRNRAGTQYKTGIFTKSKVKTQRCLKSRLLKDRGASCERCGYDKQETLSVHHKNRDREDSKLENLELICPNCHAEEHYSKDSWFTSEQVLKNGGNPAG